MNRDEVVEEISLGSPEHVDAGLRQTDRTFRQVSHLKGYRATYEIFNGRFLQAHIRGTHTKARRYTMDLAFLCTQPARRITISWRLFALALVATATAALLAAYMRDASQSLALNVLLPMVIVTGTVAAVAGLLALHKCSNRLLFHSEHGGVVLLELLNKGPRNKEFRAFVEDIIRCIQQTRAQRYASDSAAFLVDELREHRRLKKEVVIDEREYELARVRILRCHGAKQE